VRSCIFAHEPILVLLLSFLLALSADADVIILNLMDVFFSWQVFTHLLGVIQRVPFEARKCLLIEQLRVNL
jgi:hypothetical protein